MESVPIEVDDMSFKNILVALDGSQNSQIAAENKRACLQAGPCAGIDEAKQFGGDCVEIVF